MRERERERCKQVKHHIRSVRITLNLTNTVKTSLLKHIIFSDLKNNGKVSFYHENSSSPAYSTWTSTTFICKTAWFDSITMLLCIKGFEYHMRTR